MSASTLCKARVGVMLAIQCVLHLFCDCQNRMSPIAELSIFNLMQMVCIYDLVGSIKTIRINTLPVQISLVIELNGYLFDRTFFFLSKKFHLQCCN